METGRPRLFLHCSFLESAAGCPFLSGNFSAHRNHILCQQPVASLFFVAVQPFRSSPQLPQAVLQHASSHLHPQEQKMLTKAFLAHQQEDGSEHPFLYIHPYATSAPPPLPEEKEPSTAPEFHCISPPFWAAPRIRAFNLSIVPSECQVFSQR